MFTGIVERRAKVASVRERAGGREIVLVPLEGQGLPPWRAPALGESVSVSGVCLTVSRVARGGREMAFDAVPETVSRTTLGGLRTGDLVNLERSLAVGDLLGGHFVSGHIDATGTIAARETEGTQVHFQIGAPAEFLGLLIPKGSVAVDGLSLTVVEVDREGGRFGFVAIPHTLGVTTLGSKKVRDPINLEADIMGKWIIHGLREILGAGGLPPTGGTRR